MTRTTTHRATLPLIVGFLEAALAAVTVGYAKVVILPVTVVAGTDVLVAEVPFPAAQLATDGNGGVPGRET
jgi:hypothetical protein